MPVRAFMLLLAVVGLSGCLQPEKARLQSGEDKERSATRTVGDVTSFANANSIQVCGVGLVVGLDGTGGGMPVPGGYRDMIENDLRKQGVESTKEILSNPEPCPGHRLGPDPGRRQQGHSARHRNHSATQQQDQEPARRRAPGMHSLQS